MRLRLHHYAPPRGAGDAPRPVWRTCLREIEFADDDHAEAPAGATATSGADAYRLLLEIVCGLHSPLAGETQVQGQFKAFLDSLQNPADAWIKQLGRRVLTDARAVREMHLRGLGARSYGSAVRARVHDCERVALIGAGALGGELLEYLAGAAIVDRWGRRDPDPRTSGRPVLLLDQAENVPAAAEPSALVIAAPVTAAQAVRVGRRYTGLRHVIDLRQERDDLAALGAPVVTLDGIFAGAAAARMRAEAQIDRARHEAAARADAWARHEQLRPFGWEDLCA